MKKIAVIFALCTISYSTYAIDGHNGIRFDMNQQQLESIGFICNSNAEQKMDGYPIATCKHMDMAGIAFSVPTNNYSVNIGPDKHVASIRADLVGIRSTAEYLAMITNISGFFPNKDEAGSRSYNGGRIMTNAWRANNNAGISVTFFAGVKGMTKDTLWVSFISPNQMAIADRNRSETSTKKARGVKRKVD